RGETTHRAPRTGPLRVGSPDQSPQAVTAPVGGPLPLSGPGLSSLVTSASASQTFAAAAFDGSRDYSGTSGHDFGPQSTPGSQPATLTAASDLTLFTGTGTVSFTESAAGTSSASSTG